MTTATINNDNNNNNISLAPIS